MGLEYGARVTQIAQVCHEANRALCKTQGDNTQVAWDDAPAWQRDSAIAGVDGILTGTVQTPRDAHESWLEQKHADGWQYGPVKDPKKKLHPCFVAYDALPPEQQLKDALFFAIVKALGE